MRYGVLGPVEARIDGEVLAIGGPQQRRVLALLLQRPGHSVSTDRMVDCLWAEGEAPEGAGRSVMTYVSRLRSALGEHAVERVGDGYRLMMNGDTLDASEFETCLSEAESADPGRAIELYERALGLWRGDAYGDLGQEWWLLAEANRLNDLRLAGMDERTEVMVMLGQVQRAIPELNWMRSTHPLRERPASLLMQALFASGRQADALREFQAYRSQLAEATGLDPSAELQALEQSIALGEPAVPPTARLRPLRGYTIHAVIGEGAFGRVLAATQPGTNRDVAIKVIRPDLADDPTFVQRFEAEAQLVARLEHPHIVPLYDYWREPGGAYLVFRLLTGGTAQAALVSGGAFDVVRVSRIVEEIGSALMAAHGAGVVHCDVKPANVLFDAAGNSYLGDFGIALASSVDESEGRSRGYDVPELAESTSDTVRSDIFSFGCMLWQLLAGDLPHTTIVREQGTGTSTFTSRFEPWPGWCLPSLAGRINEPSAAIDAVIARATESDPALRYASMAELIVAWRAAVGRQGGVLTPVDQPAGSFTSSARRRAASDLAAGWSESVNPYKGLRAFTEADAEDFFGRDDVAVALRDALSVRRFVAVVGPSGSGKSSVVHAGLAPLLREEGARIASMVPGERPGDALREALRSVATTRISTADEGELIEAAIADGAGDLVIVVDQFEECWTLADVADRERFLSALAQAVSRHVRCLVTVRADLYDRPLQHQLVGPLMADGTFPLPPLGPEALQESVVRPARRNGVEFDEGVSTAIVAEASAHPAGLPLLQFALAELYERRVDGRITAGALHELGGIGGAVGRRAEETYLALGDDLQPHARELFGRVVAPGLGSPDTRRRARLGELSQPTRDVAGHFVQARLLVADRDLASREPVVEVAHEALLSNWPRLREWLESDRDWIHQLQHIATASRGWSESDHAEGELYRGSRLEAVLEALPERGDELNEEERAFVEASRQSRDADLTRERRRNRRLRRLLGAAVCLVAVAVIAGLLAYGQSRSADRSRREAQITTLIDRSLAMRSSNRDAAALLAIESNRLQHDSASAGALLGTFTHDPGFLGYLTFDGARVQGAVVPDTNTAVVSMGGATPGVPDTPLRSVDLVTGEVSPFFEPIGPGDYMFVFPAVSADGRVAIAYGSPARDGFSNAPIEIRAFEIATGSAIGPRIALPEAEGNTVTVNGDGSQIAVGGGEAGDVRIFDSATGELVTTIAAAPDMVRSVYGVNTSSAAWAPDGHLYVGSSGRHLREFDGDTFELLRDITVPEIATGGVLDISDDGAFLIGLGIVQRDDELPGSMVRVDLATGTVAWTMDPDEFGFFGCAVFTFSVPQNRLLCADTNGVVRGRSLTTGEFDGTTFEHQRSQLHGMKVYSFGGHEYLASFGKQAPSIGRWRIDGTGPIARDTAAGYDGAMYSPDGRRLLVIGPSQIANRPQFAIWDGEADREVLALAPDVDGGVWLDDDRIGVVTDAGRARVIDVTTGSTRDLAFGVPSDWTAIGAVGNRRIAFGYGDGHAEVFGFEERTTPLRLQMVRDGVAVPIQVNQIAASPDGDRIYLSGRGLYMFDGTDGRQLAVTPDFKVEMIAVADHGPIAAGNVDGTITLHDPDDLSVVGTLPGARTWVDSVDYSADGRFLLAKAGDQTMALYDVATRQPMGDAIPIGNSWTADLRPDATQIAVSNIDHPRITLWNLDTAILTRAACAIAGRNLTHSEWHAYIGDLADYHLTCPEYPVPHD